jgi:hypothetical protein
VTHLAKEYATRRGIEHEGDEGSHRERLERLAVSDEEQHDAERDHVYQLDAPIKYGSADGFSDVMPCKGPRINRVWSTRSVVIPVKTG